MRERFIEFIARHPNWFTLGGLHRTFQLLFIATFAFMFGFVGYLAVEIFGYPGWIV